MSLKKISCVAAMAGMLAISTAGCAWIEEQTGFGQKTQIGAAGGATATCQFAAFILPFQGDRYLIPMFPGRCPGLICSGPFRAKFDIRLRRCSEVRYHGKN